MSFVSRRYHAHRRRCPDSGPFRGSHKIAVWRSVHHRISILIVPAVCGIATELNERIEPALKTDVAKEVLRECVSALHRRMDAYEKTRLTAFATLLDSRMKERAFLDSINAERAKAGLIDELDRRMSQSSLFSEARLPEHLEASIGATQGRRILGFLDKRDQEPVTPTSNSERFAATGYKHESTRILAFKQKHHDTTVRHGSQVPVRASNLRASRTGILRCWSD